MNDFSRQVSNKDARGMPMGIVLLPESLTVRGCLGTGNETFYENEFSYFDFFHSAKYYGLWTDLFVFFQVHICGNPQSVGISSNSGINPCRVNVSICFSVFQYSKEMLQRTAE